VGGVAPLLAVEVALAVAPAAALRWLVLVRVLGLEALQARPGLDQAAVDREVLIREQRPQQFSGSRAADTGIEPFELGREIAQRRIHQRQDAPQRVLLGHPPLAAHIGEQAGAPLIPAPHRSSHIWWPKATILPDQASKTTLFPLSSPDVAGKAGWVGERLFDAPEEKSLRTLRYELDLTSQTIEALEGRIRKLQESPTLGFTTFIDTEQISALESKLEDLRCVRDQTQARIIPRRAAGYRLPAAIFVRARTSPTIAAGPKAIANSSNYSPKPYPLLS
jgi:hypothetical protein